MKTKKRYIPDLVQMAAVCEANYIRLLKLLPPSSDSNTFAINTDASPVRVTIKVTEEHKYTTMLEIHQTGMKSRWLQPQSIHVRMYHDANMAEVLHYQNNERIEGRYTYPNPKMRAPDEKQQLNVFLAQWLTHCLEHGTRIEQSFSVAF